MTTLVVVSLVVGFVLTARAVEPARWSHWRDFSMGWALFGWVAVWMILAVVSVCGVLAGRQLQGGDPTILADVISAAAVQGALRRMRSSDRGGTLALGFLPDVFTWVEQGVSTSVHDWASKLADADLVAAAAALDRRGKKPPTETSVRQRARWRQQMVDLIADGGSVRDQARLDLIDYVVVGYRTYRMTKPS